MSTAPPPSAGEGAATPQPAPEGMLGGGDGGSTADPSQTTEATGQDGLDAKEVLTRSSKIKPIKLPGVMEDGPGPEETEAAAQRVRDERGRFVKAADSQGGPTEREPAPGVDGEVPEVPEPPVDPNAPKKYVFAGKEYDSPEQAEQSFKSLQGQFKPLIEARDAAAHSANGWKQVADGQQARIQQLEAELAKVQQAPQPQSQPAEQGQSEQAQADIDWDLYAVIRQAAEAEGNPWKADRWLHEQMQEAIKSREAALRDELTKPYREAQARQQTLAEVEQLASSLAEYVNDSDGQPSFPELRDSRSAYMIGKLWQQMGLPPQYATTPQGMVAAIALYRMIESQSAQPEPTSQAPVPASPPAPDPALAAAELGGGKPESMPSAAAGDVDPRAAAMLAGLRRTALTRKGLGFSD